MLPLPSPSLQDLSVCRRSRSHHVASTWFGDNWADQPLDLGARGRARRHATSNVLRGLDRIIGLEIVGWIPLILVDLDFITLSRIALSAVPYIPLHGNRSEVVPRPYDEREIAQDR